MKLEFQLLNEDEPNSIGATAAGYLKKLSSFDFLFIVTVLDELFSVTIVITNELQHRELHLGRALDLIDSTLESLKRYKDKSHLESTLKDLVARATELNIKLPWHQSDRVDNGRKRKR